MAAGAPDTINSMALGKHSMLRRLSSHYRALQFSPSLSLPLSILFLWLTHLSFPPFPPAESTFPALPYVVQAQRSADAKKQKKGEKKSKRSLSLTFG